MNAAIIDLGFAFRIDISQRVLHPFFIITLWEILTRMTTTAFFARISAFYSGDGLDDKIIELKCLDEVGIPNQ